MNCALKKWCRRYFHEVLDQGKVELVGRAFSPALCDVSSGGTVVGIGSVRGVAERRQGTFSSLKRDS